MRSAIASGVVHAGLVGSSRFVYDVWGKPLNLVRTLVQDARANEIRITEAVYRQLGPDNGFEPRSPTTSLMLGEIESFGRTARLPDGKAPADPNAEAAADAAPREAAQ